jgi:hypothetical protein
MNFLSLCAVVLSFYAAQGQELRGSAVAIADNSLPVENSIAPEIISRQLKIDVANEPVSEDVNVEAVGDENLQKLTIVTGGIEKTKSGVGCVDSKSRARELIAEFVASARKASSRSAFMKVTSDFVIRATKLSANKKIRLTEATALTSVFSEQFKFKEVPDKDDIDARIRRTLESYYKKERTFGKKRAEKVRKNLKTLKESLSEVKSCERNNLDDYKSRETKRKPKSSESAKKTDGPKAAETKTANSSKTASETKKRRLVAEDEDVEEEDVEVDEEDMEDENIVNDEDEDMSNLASSRSRVSCKESKENADAIASHFSSHITNTFKASTLGNAKKEKVIPFSTLRTIIQTYNARRQVSYSRKKIREEEDSVLGVFFDTIKDTKLKSAYLTEKQFRTAFNDALKISKKREKQLAIETVSKIERSIEDLEDESEVVDICATKRLYPEEK